MQVKFTVSNQMSATSFKVHGRRDDGTDGEMNTENISSQQELFAWCNSIIEQTPDEQEKPGFFVRERNIDGSFPPSGYYIFNFSTSPSRPQRY